MAVIRRQLGHPKRHRRLPGGRGFVIVASAALLIALSSFYIYQRVWVRSLISEIDQLKETNQTAHLATSNLRARWMSASSLRSVEEIMIASKINMQPTPPARNLSLKPDMTSTASGRFAGLGRAFDKIKKSVPFLSTNDADAGEIFKKR